MHYETSSHSKNNYLLNTSKTGNSKNNADNDPFLLKEKADAFFIVKKACLSDIHGCSGVIQNEKRRKREEGSKEIARKTVNAIRKHCITKSLK